MTLKTSESTDADFYELMKYYDEEGILLENEYLLARFRQYVEERFDYMDRSVLLKYCDLLKDLGMLFEDHDLINRLNNNFQGNYHSFELGSLIHLLRLSSYCFYKPPGLLALLRDSIGVRSKKVEEILALEAADTLALVEALTVGGHEWRDMSQVVMSIVRKTDLLRQQPEVA